MATEPFSDLRSAYSTHEKIVVSDLPELTQDVLVRTAHGAAIHATLNDDSAMFDHLPEGTHALEARSTSDEILAEEFFTVRRHQGEDPIMGFATSFGSTQQESVLSWLRRLRCTVVQVYDWMESYSKPLATTNLYRDPLGRPIERDQLEQLITGIRGSGAVAQAYAPVIAADDKFAADHPEWRLFRSDGAPQSLGDLLQIMNPGNSGWQQHWIESYGDAVDELGFNGFHLDTYGYPRVALNSVGETVSVADGYADFVGAVREARPNDVISFNQVNGVPRAFAPPTSPSFRYVEVWPPNDKWRHIEGLLQRGAGNRPVHGDTLALYPPVWGDDRNSALRTGILSEAIITVLGANTLIWGDDNGVLCHPYYVNHEQLRGQEIATVLEWHRFGLRCRDLFKGRTDTSWYELDDENASVIVLSSTKASPEPVGDALFVRVIRSDEEVVVSVLDLSGSVDGSWSSGTGPGTCTSAKVSILVDAPDKWQAEASVLGRDEGRFTSLETSVVSMREGRGVSCDIRIDGGWSVLRLATKL